MGKLKLPCGHSTETEGMQFGDIAACFTCKTRYRWQPAMWIEVKKRDSGLKLAQDVDRIEAKERGPGTPGTSA